MGEDGDSTGIISKECLDQFAALFDRSEYAIDPNSRDAKEAESELSSLMDQVYRNKVQQKFPQSLRWNSKLSFADFARES